MDLVRASSQGFFSTVLLWLHLSLASQTEPFSPHQKPFEVMDVFSTDDIVLFPFSPLLSPPSPGIMNPAWLECSGAFREGDDSVGLFLYLVRLRVSCQWDVIPRGLRR